MHLDETTKIQIRERLNKAKKTHFERSSDLLNINYRKLEAIEKVTVVWDCHYLRGYIRCLEEILGDKEWSF